MHIKLNDKIFDELFPFHILFDQNLVIKQLGSLLKKAYGSVHIGENISNYFNIDRPINGAFEASFIQKNLNKLFIINSSTIELKLKGQIIYLKDHNAFLFICAPVITDITTLTKLGLDLDDFPWHDSTADLLYSKMVREKSLQDAKAFNIKIADKNTELETKQLELEDALKLLTAKNNELAESQKELRFLNENLERIVLKRTSELQKSLQELKSSEEVLYQKAEELEIINESLNSSQILLMEQKKELEHMHKNIKASINSAKNIQEAILPFDERLSNSFSNYFVLFMPRDVVSGDFYWFQEKKGKTIIAAIDCTGHGIPGGFMSMIAHALLNHIVMDKGIVEADQILNTLHIDVRKSLKQHKTENRDGMDIALCVIDQENRILEFAGAHNPLLLVQNDDLRIVEADKIPIGGHSFGKTPRTFSKQVIDISIPTTFYIFSDGFQDQIGGPEGKKFMKKNFVSLLFSNHQKNMLDQKENLHNTIDDWMGTHKQIDDILVLGVRFD